MNVSLHTRTLALVFTVAALVSSTAQAANYAVDAAHASASFQISHLGFSKTHGSFKEIAGTFSFDPEKPEKASTDVTIQAASIDTGNEDRDKHLRNEDFFDVEKHPTLSFKSTAWKQTGEKTFDVTGDFTLRGVTKPVTVPVTLLGMGKGFKGEEIAGFSSDFKIKRNDFGMDKLVGDSMIGDEVTISVSFEGVKQ